MKKTLGIIGASAIAGIGLLAFSSGAQAATHTNLAGWAKVANGQVELTDNGVKLTTTENADKVEWFKSVSVKLGAVSNMSYQTKKLDNGDEASNKFGMASYKIAIDVNGDGTTDTTAVYEPYWQPSGTVNLPTYDTHTWDVKSGKFWLTKKVDDDFLPGAGGPPFYTWQQFVDAWHDKGGKVVAFGVGQGTYNPNTITLVDDVKFDGDTNKWAKPVVTTPPATKSPTATPTKTPTQPVAKDCEAYLYYGSNVDLCDRFSKPTGKVNCKDVGYKVKLVNANNDPWGLDGNRGVKGVGCESYPVRDNLPKPTKTASPTPSASTAVPSNTISGSPAAGGGSLPVTGSKPGTIAALGGIAIVIGAIGIIATKRRRGKVNFQA